MYMSLSTLNQPPQTLLLRCVTEQDVHLHYIHNISSINKEHMIKLSLLQTALGIGYIICNLRNKEGWIFFYYTATLWSSLVSTTPARTLWIWRE